MIGRDPSTLVHDDEEDDLSQLSPKQIEERERTRIAKRSSVAGYEVITHDGKPARGILGWAAMPPEARATACVAALFASFELDTRIMFYDQAARVAFAVQPDPNVKGRQKGTGRAVPKTVQEAIAPALAAFGMRGAAIAQFITRKR